MVSTLLTTRERAQVDAAGLGTYATCHRDSVDEVARDLRRKEATRVLLSVRRFDERESLRSVRQLVREMPRTPTIALLTAESSQTATTLLELGRSGVKTLVDTRLGTGWKRLRNLLSLEAADVVRDDLISRLNRGEEERRHPRCIDFFDALARASQTTGSVRNLACSLGILPSTLMSRFFRAGLPAPKRYLTMVRLMRAAYLLENPGFSIANVADYLEYSSPQSFGRHVKTTLRMTALRFRRRYNAMGMLDLIETQLIEPYRHTLRSFDPLYPVQ